MFLLRAAEPRAAAILWTRWTNHAIWAKIRPMDAEAKAAHRRAYKRNWMAKKRRSVRAARGEAIELFLPHQLAADLRRRKPKGVGLAQWLVVELRHKVAKTPAPEPEPVAAASAVTAVSAAERNKPCPCGCGRKAKHCTSRTAEAVSKT